MLGFRLGKTHFQCTPGCSSSTSTSTCQRSKVPGTTVLVVPTANRMHITYKNLLRVYQVPGTSTTVEWKKILVYLSTDYLYRSTFTARHVRSVLQLHVCASTCTGRAESTGKTITMILYTVHCQMVQGVQLRILVQCRFSLPISLVRLLAHSHT
jgi:hypothetical protein